MTTATTDKDINEGAVDAIAGTCRERINEMLPDLLTYVDASQAAGKITLSITLTPVKDTPGAYYHEVVPTLNVKGMRTEGAASIERIGRHLQLKLAGVSGS